MVSVTGQASDPGDFGRSCDRGFTFHLEVPARELLFDPRWHPYDPGFIEAMVVEDVDDAGGCPVAYGLHPNHDRARSALKALGDVSVDPLEDGDARVFLAHSIELRLHPGQAIRLEGRTDPHSFPDTVLVENHGAWPRSGLRAVEHDGYW
jgi:hypothetical protein